MAAVLAASALAGVLMCNAYPVFRDHAQAKMEALRAETSEDGEGATSVAEETALDEELRRYIQSSIYYMNYEITPEMDAYEYLTQNYDMTKMSGSETAAVREASKRLMKNMRNQYVTVQSLNGYSSYALGVEKQYGSDSTLERIIQGDTDLQDYYAAGLVVSYDSRGVPSVRQMWGIDGRASDELASYLTRTSMIRLMEDNGMERGSYVDETYEEDLYEEGSADEIYEETYEESDVTEKELPEAETYGDDGEADAETASPALVARGSELLRQIPVPIIQNTTFAFGLSENRDYGISDPTYDYWIEYDAYFSSGYAVAVGILIASMALLALILQNLPALGLRESRLFRLPAEVTAVVGLTGLSVTLSLVLTEFGVYTLKNGSDSFAGDLAYLGLGDASSTAAVLLLWLFWSCLAFGWYWFTASLLPYVTHPVRTLREQLLCLALWSWLKKQCLRLWHWATDIRLDQKLENNIWKLVGLNGLIVAFLCVFWIGGIFGTIVYSVLVFFLIRRKCGQMQEDYEKLLKVTRAIADGDLNASADVEMGVFDPIRDEIASIQRGFRKAVDEEVRSRNMKTELITNVSHDLKTPLTAIITYVDLLKKEGLTEEERASYVATLEKKSQRLKVLIEDLFEVSKATTNNIVMNYEEVDLVSLIKQVRLENEEKIAASELDFRWSIPEERCVLRLDPQRTFRIIDNLVQNILKYSMPRSRVYISLKETERTVRAEFKNMSAEEMNFTPEEIKERFVRGDLSRNTEGSGLGLAIAQSFTELQGGTFAVETDGDLFKVTLEFPRTADAGQ
ncbi:MAG: HAMP domain-containing sensor histidine kinase [Eubacteriales bacterium]|nr:HAMP domain-containing sensor histidine kinase [Eubacteriales bacterium]